MSKGVKITSAIILALIILSLPFLLNEYIQQILILTITYAMLGLSFAFTMKVGLPRFDIAAWWGIGAYATAMLMWKGGLSFWLTLPISAGVAVFIGLIAFLVIIPRGMMVFLLFGMVLTLAVQQVFGSIEFFGGWGGTPPLPPPTIGSFTFMGKPELYYMGLVFLGFNVIVYRALYNSKIGRAWNAIGSSLKLASSLGIDIVRYRIANVLISNVFAALAGSYFAACTLIVLPNAFNFSNSVYVMMYAVVGGLAHTLAGPIIGALIITFVPEYLRLAREWEPVITAAVIILIIIFMPMGVLGVVDRIRGAAAPARKWFVIRRRAKGEPRTSA